DGRIETTVVKAKEARRFADSLVTIGKKADLHHRRIAVARLRNQDAVRKLFNEIAPGFAGREGGYTRIYKLGARRGDAAETCILELVEYGEAAAKETEKKDE
ncbi:MAG: 50S ribosomal protein L17, partial [Victivallaceae bacterium]|nr:50S ribosomal protein L17 [Victivallaceae bacterium]